MIIFETAVARRRSGQPTRGVVFGSCRVHSPVLDYAKSGGARVHIHLDPYTHTLAGALQLIDLLQHRARLPQELLPFVLGHEMIEAWPARMRLARSLFDDADVLIAEVCTDGQLLVDDVLLNTAYFHLVLRERLGPAVQDWMRALTEFGSASPKVTEKVIEIAAERGQLNQTLDHVLRNARFLRYSAGELGQQIDRFRERFGGKLILVPHVADPNDASRTMVRRREQAAILRRLAEEKDAFVFDPSVVFAHADRASVFDAGGTNIDEYAPALVPKLGRAIVSAAATPNWEPERALRAALDGQADPAPRLTIATPPTPVEGCMRQVLAERLATLGATEGGLYDHYADMLGRESLFSERGVSAYDYVTSHLPRATSINHVGASIGELPAALAAAGFRVTAHIANARRLRAAEAVREALCARGLIEPDNLRLSRAPLPTEPGDLFIAIDAVLQAGTITTPDMMAALSRHRSALIEPQNFGERRDSEAARVAFAEVLEDAGYGFELRLVGASLLFGRQEPRSGVRRLWAEYLRHGAPLFGRRRGTAA